MDGAEDPEVAALRRASKRSRRLPPDARCAECDGIEQLAARGDEVLCYACAGARAGRRPFEDDHLAGRSNWGGLTVRLRPNDHRTITELRLDLGLDDWPPAQGDPLLVLSHFLGGLATLQILLARWLIEYAGELDERLDGARPEAGGRAPIVE